MKRSKWTSDRFSLSRPEASIWDRREDPLKPIPVKIRRAEHFPSLRRDGRGTAYRVELSSGERVVAKPHEFDEARKHLAREGFDPEYGARPLKRTIQRLILDPLALKILDGEIGEGDTVAVSIDGNEVRLEREASAAA